MPSLDALLMARSPSFSERQGHLRPSCYTVYCVYGMQLYLQVLPTTVKSYDCIYSAGMQKPGRGQERSSEFNLTISQSLVFLLMFVPCQGDHELNYSIAGLLGQFRNRRWLGKKEKILKTFRKCSQKSQKCFWDKSWLLLVLIQQVHLSQCRQVSIT